MNAGPADKAVLWDSWLTAQTDSSLARGSRAKRFLERAVVLQGHLKTAGTFLSEMERNQQGLHLKELGRKMLADPKR